LSPIGFARRYNLNTLEQTALAMIAWPGLALELPRAGLKPTPATAIGFFVSRAFGFGWQRLRRITAWHCERK
jgi:hypothetical protein